MELNFSTSEFHISNIWFLHLSVCQPKSYSGLQSRKHQKTIIQFIKTKAGNNLTAFIYIDRLSKYYVLVIHLSVFQFGRKLIKTEERLAHGIPLSCLSIVVIIIFICNTVYITIYLQTAYYSAWLKICYKSVGLLHKLLFRWD